VAELVSACITWWLRVKDVSAASELLKPFDARLTRCYPVSSRVNSVVNDDPRLNKTYFRTSKTDTSLKLIRSAATQFCAG
jgi:hypothetical protein